jgi:hypothetical protein
MRNYCNGCGKELRNSTNVDKKSARIICDECWNRVKDNNLNKFLEIKNRYIPFDENFGLTPDQIEWMISYLNEFFKQ